MTLAVLPEGRAGHTAVLEKTRGPGQGRPGQTEMGRRWDAGWQKWPDSDFPENVLIDQMFEVGVVRVGQRPLAWVAEPEQLPSLRAEAVWGRCTCAHVSLRRPGPRGGAGCQPACGMGETTEWGQELVGGGEEGPAQEAELQP